MTKKHFEAIAKTFNTIVEGYLSDEECAAVKSTARALAKTFSTENPRFDRARFLEACGINE